MKKQISFILRAALCCFLWGTAIPTLKISYELLDIPAGDVFNRLVLAGMRFMLAGILIGMYIYVKERRIPMAQGSQWKKLALFGLLNTTLQYMFFYTGVGNTGAIKGVLIDTSKPLIVAILAHLLTKDDKMNQYKVAGLVIGFIGILVANLQAAVDGGLNMNVSLMGEGSLLIASVAYALAVIYGKHVLKEIPSLMLNMYQMLIGALILLGIGLVGAGGYHLEFTGFAVVLLIYSGFLSAIAFVVWYQLIDTYSASSVTVYIFLIPVFGSMISSVIFPEENMTWNVLLSLILMTASIYLVNRQPSVPERS